MYICCVLIEDTDPHDSPHYPTWYQNQSQNDEHTAVLFGNSEELSKWKWYFEQYLQALKQVEKGEENFAILQGEDAEEVLDTTCIWVDDRKKHEKVVEEFDKYYKVKKT